MVAAGHPCEISYYGKTCEVRFVVAPVMQYDEQKDMIILPGDIHIHHRDIISMMPVAAPGDPVKTGL